MSGFNIVECILLAIVTFVFAIDQFSLTEIIYRPIIACPIIGLILGDMPTGLAVGGSLELIMIGNMPVGGAQPPNAVIASIVGVIFAVKSGLKTEAALGTAMIFATFGQFMVTMMFTIMSGLMSKADKAAAEANPRGITNVLNISMLGMGTLFAVVAIVGYTGGTAMAETLTNLQKNASWLMAGFGAAGAMMRFVGFAILLKIMFSNDMWGYLLAGFALVQLFTNNAALTDAALILTAFIGVAIALNDFFTNKAIKEHAGNGMGGMSDGI